MNRGIVCMALLLAGCSHTPQSTESQQQTLQYTCGTMPLTVKLNNSKNEVKLILDGKLLTLKEQEAASGARYGNGEYVFWSKGDSAFIERHDKIIINDCQLKHQNTVG